MNNNLIVSFFDVTTLYFESKSDDELKSFGFSKDCKFNDVQVVLSILSADDGTPLTFDLFPGNTSETKTMEKCLKRLKHELNLNKITVVADRGMYTKSNLSLISSLGYNYIVGCKIRSCSKDIKEQVFNDNDYKLSQINEANYKYKEIYKADSEKIVIAHSLKRAKKDKQDRTRLIEKALKVIAGSQGTDSYGGKQYIKRVNKSMELDNEKIEEDRKWDGYYAVSHNSEFNEQEVLAAYHGLWRVENSFRMLKNYFATRPMFHWTEKRIRGHVMLNFISYVFERYIEKEISTKSEISMAPNKIREAINSMQENYVTMGKLELKVPSKFSDNALKLMTALGINMPQNAIIKSND